MPDIAMRVAGANGRGLPRKLVFTAAALSKATCPPGRDRAYLYDRKMPGLAVSIAAGGSRTFFYIFKGHGKTERVSIGKFPALSVDAARKEVARMAGIRSQGKDPAAERRAVGNSVTLQQLWDMWLEGHAKPRLRPRTIITDQSRFDTCFAGWKARRIGTITEHDVRGLHTRLGTERGKVTANRAVQLLRRLFYFARLDPNPAGRKTVEFFRETSRDRFLKPDELPAFFKALDDDPNDTFRDYVYMSLWTGARRSNVQAMRWACIDLVAKLWVIPPEETKSHEAIAIPLVDAAVDILKRRKEFNVGEYVFPSHRKQGKTPHLTDARTSWERIKKAAGLEDVHLHDLRRTLASWQTIQGTSLSVVGKTLGHKSPTSTARYGRLTMDPVRDSVIKATAAMGEAAKGEAK